MTIPRISIVTPSYRDDFELATELCRSVDKFVVGEYEHVLIVPKRDMALFQPLAGPRRRVVTQQSVLSRLEIFKLPVPTRYHLSPLFDFKIRQQWWCTGVGRVSGWVTQQIVKLSATEVTASPLILFVDSDVVLFRKFDIDAVSADATPKVHRSPMRESLQQHRQWYQTARRLIGLNQISETPYNYIGSLVLWQRHLVLDLCRAIESASGLPWHKAVAREGTVSEYILYGVFCAEKLQPQEPQVFEESKLALCCWTQPDRLTAKTLCEQLQPQQVALHLQSTLPISTRLRRELVMRLEEVAQ